MKYFIVIIIALTIFLIINRANRIDYDKAREILIAEQDIAKSNAMTLCGNKGMGYAGITIDSELKYRALCMTQSPQKIYNYAVE